MASFHDTVDLERALLKVVTSSIIMARTYLHQGREEMFTSDPRKFIFALAVQSLNEANSLLTRQIYEYEVMSRQLDEADFVGEWNMIDGVATGDPPEALIAKIKEADVGRKVLKVSEEAIEMLSNVRIKDAAAFLKREAMMVGSLNKADRPMVPLSDISIRMALYQDRLKHPEKYSGLKIGFPTFDRWTGGLFPGELTLIAGITGIGKSTICRVIAKGITTLNGAKNVLHIANEEYLEQVQYKYDALFMGFEYNDFKQARLGDEALDRWQKFMQKGMQESGIGQIFIKEVPAFTDVSLVEQQFRTLENRGIPIHAIIIDHLPHVKPIEAAWGENDERFKAAADCKELARALRLPVVTPTQAATEVEKKQASGKRAGKLDVYGSKGQVHVANTFLIITYKGTDDTQTAVEEPCRDVYWLCDAKKNRDGPPFYFTAKHRVKDGMVEEVSDPRKKPAKDAVDGVNAVVGEAEAESKKATPTSPTTVSPIPSIPRPRDAQMEFVEAIEGTITEDDGEAGGEASGSEVQQGIDDVLAEAEKAPEKATPEKTTPEKAPEKTEATYPTVPKSVLNRIRMSRNKGHGV
jgi:replicative DNA helicase